MPHKELEADELDRLFPPLPAPEEENLHDLSHDTVDHVLDHGFKLAKDIEDDMVRYGRTRKASRHAKDQNDVGYLGEPPDNDYDNDDYNLPGNDYDHDNHNGNRYDYDNHDDNHNCPSSLVHCPNVHESSDRASHSSLVHCPNVHENSMFLNDNNQDCRRNFQSHDSEHATQERVYREDPSLSREGNSMCRTLTGSALEVRSEHSLCLRGSVKIEGTVCTVNSLSRESSSLEQMLGIINVQRDRHIHAGNVWLKSQALSFG
jgi:hypothetical protein